MILEAAHSGHIDAQYAMGVLYSEGIGTEKDACMALKWFSTASDKGHAVASLRAGYIFRDGECGEESIPEGKKRFDMAIEQGDLPAAHYALFGIYTNKGDDLDTDRAIYHLHRSAVSGLDEAQHMLGMCYAYGMYVAEDFAKAFAWFSKAAMSGHADSQLYVGIHYQLGKGVVADEAKGVEWLKRAVENGSKRALLALAVSYLEGSGGLKKDVERAVSLLEQARSAGEPDADNILRAIKEDYGSQ